MNNNNSELENMRQQMETLKKKLERQEILNDRIVHQSMKRTAGKIMRRYYGIMALCLLMIPYTYLVFVVGQGLSMTFWMCTSILMLVCAGATYYNSLNVSQADMTGSNLIEVGRRMAQAKRFEARWLFFGIPAVIAWLFWLTWELRLQDAYDNRFLLYGVVCGAVIGAVIGFKMHFRTQRQYQEIIDQIGDVTADE